MLIDPTSVPVMTGQLAMCTQELVGKDGGGGDFRSQQRHMQACPVLMSRCLRGGGCSQGRHAQAGTGGWGHRWGGGGREGGGGRGAYLERAMPKPQWRGLSRSRADTDIFFMVKGL